jgi:thiol:disulfide interchange protein
MQRWHALAIASFLAAASAFAATGPFDPAANPVKDLQHAEKQAAEQHKNILLDVGGNWCPWCLLVDRTLNDDAELHALLEKNYVVLRVNMSKENENRAFLGQYPKATGYPAWYVLTPDGKLLKAEDTSELEATHKLAAGYNKDALRSFLTANAPQQ